MQLVIDFFFKIAITHLCPQPEHRHHHRRQIRRHHRRQRSPHLPFPSRTGLCPPCPTTTTTTTTFRRRSRALRHSRPWPSPRPARTRTWRDAFSSRRYRASVRCPSSSCHLSIDNIRRRNSRVGSANQRPLNCYLFSPAEFTKSKEKEGLLLSDQSVDSQFQFGVFMDIYLKGCLIIRSSSSIKRFPNYFSIHYDILIRIAIS